MARLSGWAGMLRAGQRAARRAGRMLARSARAQAAAKVTVAAPAMTRGLHRVAAFGSNPGALGMQVYAPPRLRAGRPLIVVLHGCGQHAEDFARAAGWVALADAAGVGLVLPEQRAANNRGRCFNWFRPGDVTRGGGEAMSIRQMVRHAVVRFGADRRRIYVVGFSAGGAMAAALLAAYPAVFAAGAVVAGMPVGSARTLVGAMLHMRRADRGRSAAQLAEEVRRVTGRAAGAAWPRLSVWQGGADRTVDPENAALLAGQWRMLHGLDPAPEADATQGGVRRRAWGRHGKPAAVELVTLEGLGHGVPVATGGTADGFVVAAGVDAAREIGGFWGVVGGGG